MRAAIFSHGRGSFIHAAGRLCSMNKEYDITIGSGNGSILASFAACSEYNLLDNFVFQSANKRLYDSVPPHDYSNDSLLAMILSTIRKKKLHSDVVKILVPHLNKVLSPLYWKMMTSNKLMYLIIYNLDRGGVDIKKIPADIAHERFSKFLLASLAHPLIFSKIKIGNKSYRDAVNSEPLPIMRFIDIGITELDIFVDLPKESLVDGSEAAYYAAQMHGNDSKFFQLQELKKFLEYTANNLNIKYNVLFTPTEFSDLDLKSNNVNTYFNGGYTASDLSYNLRSQ